MSSGDSSAENIEEITARPFLKWAGGKSQIISTIFDNMPVKYGRYFEPFIGGGAVFFNLRPGKASISDINDELINCYLMVREQTEELIAELEKFSNDKNYFYEIRNADRLPDYQSWSPVRKAARLIFLNRTCFNGLYRVNSRGHFNVPFGNYKNPRIVDKTNLHACSRVLAACDIRSASFMDTELRAEKGDFVYFDPPYEPLSRTSNFTAYSKNTFGKEQQIELSELCRRLSSKGVFWMLSNSNTPFIRELYSEFHQIIVPARRNINSVAEGRGAVEELLVRSY